jgi:hypothetical protein
MNIASRIKELAQPKDEKHPRLHAAGDVSVLIFFGLWAVTPAYAFLFDRSPNRYKCSGPGFVDFGCTGGIEAVIAAVIAAIIWLSVAGIAGIALMRIINRVGKDK